LSDKFVIIRVIGTLAYPAYTSHSSWKSLFAMANRAHSGMRDGSVARHQKTMDGNSRWAVALR